MPAMIISYRLPPELPVNCYERSKAGAALTKSNRVEMPHLGSNRVGWRIQLVSIRQAVQHL